MNNLLVMWGFFCGGGFFLVFFLFIFCLQMTQVHDKVDKIFVLIVIHSFLVCFLVYM